MTPHVRRLGRADLSAAASLAGLGMADNPLHRVVYPGGEDGAARAHARVVRTLLAVSPALHVDGAELGRTLVGFAAAAPVGRCRPTGAARVRLLGTASTLGPRTTARLLAWTKAWAAHDLAEEHVHLGPVSVARGLRGRGIGGLLLARHTRRLDALGAVGYLETDRPEAVGFYRRHGYDVVRTAEVLGVPCWFMRRGPVPAG
ncbi:GNAT family N-acetyltransferase [Cellulosimicrobium marinum]|uniref:GNAT family N-acetyltransferase n=1 Tax=Cellulosimicrobium marinum TaxID=1638992 RepID=UPI001E290E17|nr:GNAT family N-acetyltransferase [Cellulosimicrobium marinum]MCB7137460.1 GNAT family N-acetyltransferase [Cellulosimicrobium marinum]